VIPNPFETERFINKNSETVHEIKKELGISENMLVLGHVGRFSQEKNHEFLLELAWNLREQSHLFKIILVGDGELRQHINEKIEKMDLRNVFHITGAQSNIEDFYHLFDILLFPSLHEGFGNVAVEAQIAKKYVIASDGVSSETDLGLGLIDFISINNMDTWIELITNYNRGMATDISDEKVRRVLIDGNKFFYHERNLTLGSIENTNKISYKLFKFINISCVTIYFIWYIIPVFRSYFYGGIFNILIIGLLIVWFLTGLVLNPNWVFK